MSDGKIAVAGGPAAMGHAAEAGVAIGTAAVVHAWPWEPDQGVAAKLAIGSLQTFFLRSLARDGRLQLETLFCTVGALAGFAAQHALRQDNLCAARGKEAGAFVAVESENGERLNAMLVPHRLEDLTVWSVVAGEAMRLGTAQRDLPDCVEIFERVASSVGTSEFGVPRVTAGHEPWLMPRRAVEIFWPPVRTAFTREPVVPVPGFKLVEPRHWPLALAVVGAGYLSLAKDRFAPALAVALFMEAAIPMSKIDPGAIKFAGSPAH